MKFTKKVLHICLLFIAIISFIYLLSQIGVYVDIAINKFVYWAIEVKGYSMPLRKQIDIVLGLFGLGGLAYVFFRRSFLMKLKTLHLFYFVCITVALDLILYRLYDNILLKKHVNK